VNKDKKLWGNHLELDVFLKTHTHIIERFYRDFCKK